MEFNLFLTDKFPVFFIFSNDIEPFWRCNFTSVNSINLGLEFFLDCMREVACFVLGRILIGVESIGLEATGIEAL